MQPEELMKTRIRELIVVDGDLVENAMLHFA